jgi:Ca2+-binding EF-hand superfamily protein
MRAVRIRGVPRAAALVMAVALIGGAARAQTSKPSYDPRAAFAETDTNHDGAVDHEEFLARMTEVFYRADVNKDGVLTVDEVAVTLVQTPNLDTADANHDGKLTLHEFLTARFKDYDQVDANHDGLLELDEVVNAYEKPQKK